MQQATVTAISETQASRTFLDELNDIMTAGAFVDPDQPATNDEPAVGEMTTYERALYTLMDKYGHAQKELIVKNFDAFREFIGDAKDLPVLHRQLNNIKEHHDAAAKLLWASIKDRYHHEREDATDSTGLGIRQGFHVVLMFGEEPCGSFGNFLASMLEGHSFR